MTGVRLGNLASLRSAISLLPSLPWRENQILVDDQPHRRARPDGDRRLDAEVAHRDLALPIVLGRAAHRLDQVAVAGESQFGANAEQHLEHDALDLLPSVHVDLVLKGCIARRVGRRDVVDATMRFDEAVDPATRRLVADLAFDPLDGIQGDDDVR